MQEALERAMQALVLGEAPPADPAELAAWLSPHGLEAEEAATFRANLERLLVYRTLVRGTLLGAVELAIPRSLARLGPLFAEYFDRFLAERGPSTHYLRDVTDEWLTFVEPLFADDARVPPFLIDLARHEALEIDVASSADTTEPTRDVELDLGRGIAFARDARVVRYDFAVHELPAAPEDRSVPERRATALFVYRSREHDVRYLELSPLAANLIERLLRGQPLGAAVTEAATATLGRAPDQSMLEGTARLLADLAERGALLGAAPTPEYLERPQQRRP
jgi:hypothetical protein